MQWTDVTKPPTDRMLRQFGLLLALVVGVWAGLRGWRTGADTISQVLAGVAAVAGALGLAAPRVLRPVFTSWMVLAFPIGWTVSRLVLLAIFYLVFTPLALVFRALGRDALDLRRRDVTSFWAPKSRPTGLRQYFRQF